MPTPLARPALVLPDAWAAIPPADRRDTLSLASLAAMRAYDPDDAVVLGYAQLVHGRLLAHPRGRAAFHALSQAFDERHGAPQPAAHRCLVGRARGPQR